MPRLTSVTSGIPVLMQGSGKRKRVTRGGSVRSVLSDGAKYLAKNVLLPGTISAAKNIGKNVLLPRLKARYPWLSHLGLGRRRRRRRTMNPCGSGLFLPGN
jgi:hypothetical protein